MTGPLEHSLNTKIGNTSYLHRVNLIFIDFPLVISLFLLLSFGLLILFSASGQSYEMVYRQASYILLGIFLMLIFAQLRINIYHTFSLHLIWLSIAILTIVLIYPAEGYKTNRWIDLGFISFQPSELVRLMLPLSVASFLTRQKMTIKPKDWFVSVFAIIVCSFLVFKQPDLGTSLIIASAGLLPVFLAGFPLTYIYFILSSLILISPFIWTSLKEYQQQRILTLLDPSADPLGSGWNILQSKTAIGSGGLFGKGYLSGTQSQLDFIPESHSDFIFAVIAEEFGLMGIIVLLIFYLVILTQSMKIALNARSNFGRLAATSLIFIFAIYVLINILMVVGVFPIVGVPLPLISQGGTSIVIHLLAFGFILSLKRFDYEFK